MGTCFSTFYSSFECVPKKPWCFFLKKKRKKKKWGNRSILFVRKQKKQKQRVDHECPLSSFVLRQVERDGIVLALEVRRIDVPPPLDPRRLQVAESLAKSNNDRCIGSQETSVSRRGFREGNGQPDPCRVCSLSGCCGGGWTGREKGWLFETWLRNMVRQERHGDEANGKRIDANHG